VEKNAGDLELLEMARGGDQRAFAEIVEKYKGRVANVVKGMMGDVPEAEDVGQEVFIRFYNSLDRFRGESSLATYLTRIAINLSLNELKRKKRTYSLYREDGEEQRWPEVSDEGRPEEKRDTREVVEKALQQLEDGYRAVVVLRLIEGYSTKETAELLGIPLGTVLSRLSRAQKQLMEILKNSRI